MCLGAGVLYVSYLLMYCCMHLYDGWFMMLTTPNRWVQMGRDKQLAVSGARLQLIDRL